VLDSLRQPLERGEVQVARAALHVTYPARVQLIAAMNPCRCGHLADASLACASAPKCAADYQTRISGPLLDRIDLQIEVPAQSQQDTLDGPPGEDSAAIRARVLAARARLLDELRRALRETPDDPLIGARIILTHRAAAGLLHDAATETSSYRPATVGAGHPVAGS
jgi:predicted ATPase with chaperone activity